MNILFISTQLYPCDIGGVELFNYYLIDALGSIHNLWVMTACEAGFAKNNINVIKINTKKLKSRRLSIIYEHLKNIVKLRDKAALIYIPYMSNSWLYGCYLPFLKKVFNLPYVMGIHAGGMHPWKPKFPHKLLFRNADGLYAVSNTLKNEYEKRSGREIKVIPPIMPFKRTELTKSSLKTRYGYSEEDKIILSLGSIKKIKGNDILLNAFLDLGEEYIQERRLKLLFVGDGILRKELEKKSAQNGFSEFVNFYGKVPHNKVPEFFKLADIYVIPSLIEATPISLLEAMFNSLAIIGSDIPGITNLISTKKNGIIFKKGNYKDLKDKIEILVENAELRVDLAKNAKESYKESFNFENVVTEHLNLFQQIVEKT